MKKREKQTELWDMVRAYLSATADCIDNAYSDGDRERFEQLKSERAKWLKDNFKISRPTKSNKPINIFNVKL